MPAFAYALNLDGQPIASVRSDLNEGVPFRAVVQFYKIMGDQTEPVEHYAAPSAYCDGCETTECGCSELVTPMPMRAVIGEDGIVW